MAKGKAFAINTRRSLWKVFLVVSLAFLTECSFFLTDLHADPHRGPHTCNPGLVTGFNPNPVTGFACNPVQGFNPAPITGFAGGVSPCRRHFEPCFPGQNERFNRNRFLLHNAAPPPAVVGFSVPAAKTGSGIVIVGALP